MNSVIAVLRNALAHFDCILRVLAHVEEDETLAMDGGQNQPGRTLLIITYAAGQDPDRAVLDKYWILVQSIGRCRVGPADPK